MNNWWRISHCSEQSNLMRSSYRWCTEETGIKSTVAKVRLLSNSGWVQVKSRRQNVAIQHSIKPVSCSTRQIPASTVRGRWEERGVMLDQSWFCISEGWRQADSSPPMSPLGRRTPQLIGQRSCAPFERTHERNAVIKNEHCHFSLKERNKSGKKKKKLWSLKSVSLKFLVLSPSHPWFSSVWLFASVF